MELRHLRYFVAIAEESSFTRAAERLWISQPGLSVQMRRLEGDLGVQLLERQPRGVELTSAGELFLERARDVLEAAALAQQTGRDLASGAVGHLRVGVATGTGWRGTSSLLAEFNRDHDGVAVTVLESCGGTLWHDLRNGRLDAVIAADTVASGDLERVALGAEPWLVALAHDHRLAGAQSVSTADLHGAEIALMAHPDAAGYDRAVTELLRAMNACPVFVRAAPGPGLLRAAAAGSTLVLVTAPEAVPEQVVTRPLSPAHSIGMLLLWRAGDVSPALSTFVDLCRRRSHAQSLLTQRLSAVA